MFVMIRVGFILNWFELIGLPLFFWYSKNKTLNPHAAYNTMI